MGPDSGVGGLPLHDGDGGEGTDGHDHRNRGKDERNLIADHLRNGAHRAQQGVFISAGPAGHEDRQFDDGAGGKKVEDPGIQIDGHHISTDRQNCVA